MCQKWLKDEKYQAFAFNEWWDIIYTDNKIKQGV